MVAIACPGVTAALVEGQRSRTAAFRVHVPAGFQCRSDQFAVVWDPHRDGHRLDLVVGDEGAGGLA
jgi:hypothetical protein